MKQTNLANIAISGLLLFTGCAFGTPHNEGKEMEAKFISPPNEYRPQPFWHINGELTKRRYRTSVVCEQIGRAHV